MCTIGKLFQYLSPRYTVFKTRYQKKWKSCLPFRPQSEFGECNTCFDIKQEIKAEKASKVLLSGRPVFINPQLNRCNRSLCYAPHARIFAKSSGSYAIIRTTYVRLVSIVSWNSTWREWTRTTVMLLFFYYSLMAWTKPNGHCQGIPKIVDPKLFSSLCVHG